MGLIQHVKDYKEKRKENNTSFRTPYKPTDKAPVGYNKTENKSALNKPTDESTKKPRHVFREKLSKHTKTIKKQLNDSKSLNTTKKAYNQYTKNQPTGKRKKLRVKKTYSHATNIFGSGGGMGGGSIFGSGSGVGNIFGSGGGSRKSKRSNNNSFSIL